MSQFSDQLRAHDMEQPEASQELPHCIGLRRRVQFISVRRVTRRRKSLEHHAFATPYGADRDAALGITELILFPYDKEERLMLWVVYR